MPRNLIQDYLFFDYAAAEHDFQVDTPEKSGNCMKNKAHKVV
jgi:hypothetical protein